MLQRIIHGTLIRWLGATLCLAGGAGGSCRRNESQPRLEGAARGFLEDACREISSSTLFRGLWRNLSTRIDIKSRACHEDYKQACRRVYGNIISRQKCESWRYNSGFHKRRQESYLHMQPAPTDKTYMQQAQTPAACTSASAMMIGSVQLGLLQAMSITMQPRVTVARSSASIVPTLAFTIGHRPARLRSSGTDHHPARPAPVNSHVGSAHLRRQRRHGRSCGLDSC